MGPSFNLLEIPYLPPIYHALFCLFYSSYPTTNIFKFLFFFPQISFFFQDSQIIILINIKYPIILYIGWIHMLFQLLDFFLIRYYFRNSNFWKTIFCILFPKLPFSHYKTTLLYFFPLFMYIWLCYMFNSILVIRLFHFSFETIAFSDFFFTLKKQNI